MITLNKSMIILPHEEMIKKLEETRLKRKILFRKLDQYFGKNKISSNLKRNENGRPILNLKSLKDTYINVLTQYEYDILMQIYECSDWKWQDGDIPTRYNAWISYKEKTCIAAFDGFRYGDILRFQDKCLIKTSKEFYEIQDPQIGNKIIEESNKWFETNNPDRRSKNFYY